MDPEQIPAEPTNKTKLHLSLDLRLVVALLLVVIVAMIVVWRPWSSSRPNDRTVSVTGEATISAEPDEYVFYPSYQFKHANKDTALADLTKKSDEVIAALKKLGVGDSQIKSGADGYDHSYYFDPNSGLTTYSLRLTVTVKDKKLAQKAQDYLVTTSPVGSVTPQANFSDAKRKDLENQARDGATKDARAKADQSARNLGFKIGKVKSVSDGTGFGDVYPLGVEGGASSLQAGDSKRQLTIQPGENDLHYSVTVVYFVK
jgi:uncharacterized protein